MVLRSAFVSHKKHIPRNYSVKIPVLSAVIEPPASFYKIYVPILSAPGKTLLLLIVSDPELSSRLHLGVLTPTKYHQEVQEALQPGQRDRGSKLCSFRSVLHLQPETLKTLHFRPLQIEHLPLDAMLVSLPQPNTTLRCGKPWHPAMVTKGATLG